MARRMLQRRIRLFCAALPSAAVQGNSAFDGLASPIAKLDGDGCPTRFENCDRLVGQRGTHTLQIFDRVSQPLVDGFFFPNRISMDAKKIDLGRQCGAVSCPPHIVFGNSDRLVDRELSLRAHTR